MLPSTQPSSPEVIKQSQAVPGSGTPISAPQQAESGGAGTATSEHSTSQTAETGDVRSTPTLEELLENADLDELVKKNRRLAGKVGQLADDLAKKKAEQIRQEIARQAREQAEEERLNRLLEDDDLITYKEEKKRIDERRKREREEVISEQDRLTQTLSQLDNMVINPIFYSLPQAVQQELANKTYEGDFLTARRAFIQDVIGRAAEHAARERFEKELPKRLTEAQMAARKEALGQANGAEPSPDLGYGAAAPGALTQREWDENRHNRAWRMANRDRINASLASGAIANRA